jgi:TetR/AcrR family transcriptional regulator, transcriptional repressor for nem operon
MLETTTRKKIIEAADRLFYERGFESTSFADVAAAVRISRGNFYYHFKSKDEILQAVIAFRLVGVRKMLDAWEAEGRTPADRIRSFIRILIGNRAKIMRYGCPVGTLCNELAKINHVARDDANGLFTLFRQWLAQQFEELGRPAEADTLAVRLLARSQGVATLANTLRDEEFIRREVEDMCCWLDAQTPIVS